MASEKPILFSAPMVRAILAGKKTQTRRLINPQPPPECGIHYMLGDESWLPREQRTPLRHTWEAWWGERFDKRPPKALCGSHDVRCPYGAPGDTLWVRETFAGEKNRSLGSGRLFYRADGDVRGRQETFSYIEREGRWRPAIHLPRWGSRLTLRVLSVRVERVQEITHEDAIAEGCAGHNWVASSPLIAGPHTDDGELPVEEFERLWDEINGKRAPWDSNPWVWVVEFERVTDAERAA